MPWASASCLNFCSQASKLPVLRQFGAVAAEASWPAPAKSAAASHKAAPEIFKNSRVMMNPPDRFGLTVPSYEISAERADKIAGAAMAGHHELKCADRPSSGPRRRHQLLHRGRDRQELAVRARLPDQAET